MGTLDNFGMKPDKDQPILTPKKKPDLAPAPTVTGGWYTFNEEITFDHPNPAADGSLTIPVGTHQVVEQTTSQNRSDVHWTLKASQNDIPVTTDQLAQWVEQNKAQKTGK
jgi:hypothetical protein